MTIIDLRSDTVTLPTEEMLEAMRNAAVGDDSRDGDPTVQALEALAAARTGKESGLFMPSGTMANLVALLTHGDRGKEVMLEEGSHILNSEVGGFSALAGLVPRPIAGDSGAMDMRLVQNALSKKNNRQRLGVGLICMETTHNRAGGTVLPLDHMAAVFELAKEHNVPVHTDGARLFNAAVALGVGAEKIAAYTDTVCFCISKGLSCPVGSVLTGPAPVIERARAFRRMVGGNMRQAGVIAAAGIVALQSMVSRLADDHKIAQLLADGLKRIHPSLVDVAVQTNIIRVNVKASGRDAAFWAGMLEQHGVRVAPYATWVLRFVTHRHITHENVQEAIAVFETAWHEIVKPIKLEEAGVGVPRAVTFAQ